MRLPWSRLTLIMRALAAGIAVVLAICFVAWYHSSSADAQVPHTHMHWTAENVLPMLRHRAHVNISAAAAPSVAVTTTVAAVVAKLPTAAAGLRAIPTLKLTRAATAPVATGQQAKPPSKLANASYAVGAWVVAAPNTLSVAVLLALATGATPAADADTNKRQQRTAVASAAHILGSPRHVCHYDFGETAQLPEVKATVQGHIASVHSASALMLGHEEHVQAELTDAAHVVAVMRCMLPPEIVACLTAADAPGKSKRVLSVTVALDGADNEIVWLPHTPVSVPQGVSVSAYAAAADTPRELNICYMEPLHESGDLALATRHVVDVIEYNRMLGVAHIVIYLGHGLWQAGEVGSERANPYLRGLLHTYKDQESFVTFVDAGAVDAAVGAAGHNAALLASDCLLRMSDRPRFVWFATLDEVLVASNGTRLMDAMLLLSDADKAAHVSDATKTARKSLYRLATGASITVATDVCEANGTRTTLADATAARKLVATSFARYPYLAEKNEASSRSLANYVALSATIHAVSADAAVCSLPVDHKTLASSALTKFHAPDATQNARVCATFASPGSPRVSREITDVWTDVRQRSQAVVDLIMPLAANYWHDLYLNMWQPVDELVHSRAVNGDIIMATVSDGFVSMAVNWLCTLERVALSNYVFHAADQKAFEDLKKLKLPVFFFESTTSLRFRAANHATFSAGPVDYGTVAYQALISSRLEVVAHLMHIGVNVLTCDVDTLFMSNPFLQFDNTLDLQGGAHRETGVTGGFLYLRATVPMQTFWAQLRHQHSKMFATIQAGGHYDPDLSTEQFIMNTMLKNPTSHNLKWKPIPETIVASGQRVFVTKQTFTHGEWPAVIHANWIIGLDQKIARFRKMHMWLINEDLKCRPFPAPLPPPPTANKFQMTIKVLAFDRPESLQRLLQSLADDDYHGDKVSLDIYVDVADSRDDDVKNNVTILANNRQTIDSAYLFQWTHGPKNVHVPVTRLGLALQWIECWKPEGDNEVAMILEDDMSIVRGTYTFVRQAVSTYYYDPSNYDPRVYAFNLQHQMTIAGNYGKTPSELLKSGVLFYRYQLLSTWAPVFFPAHWRNFRAWFAERSAQQDFVPLFSNLITNKWFLTRGGGKSVWSAWFIRYAAERGIYSIYTNFPNHEALALNWREKGNNFLEAKGTSTPPLRKLTKEMMVFPPISQLPLYDFHFNRIREDPRILEERGLWADPSITQTLE